MSKQQEPLADKLRSALSLVDSLKRENNSLADKYDKINLEFRQLSDRNERVMKELVIVTREKVLIN